jgi:hypothetical protein
MSEACARVHQIANGLPRLRFPFSRSVIPRNGIYLLFEEGETAHGADRIVRVGTHTGPNNLPARLMEHFIKENKDRSIFRKNIGRAILNKAGDPFLDRWDLDLTAAAAKRKHVTAVDWTRKTEVERQVTEYIQTRCSFVVFEVTNKAKRLSLEAKLISAVSLCDECLPSGTWFGRSSPVEKIREGGLWLVKGLYREPLSGEDLKELASLLQVS